MRPNGLCTTYRRHRGISHAVWDDVKKALRRIGMISSSEVNEREIERMRIAGENRRALAHQEVALARCLQRGVTTRKLDGHARGEGDSGARGDSSRLRDYAAVYRLGHALRSTPRWFTGFPTTPCSKDGDIISVDIGAWL
ncbi:MAG: hypothetical protein MZU97_20995 [Bacillus subtilis]|nr:hypothetical protein [Bacillus subtilis]